MKTSPITSTCPKEASTSGKDRWDSKEEEGGLSSTDYISNTKGGTPPTPKVAISTSIAPTISNPLDGIIGFGPDCQFLKKKLLGQGSFGSAWRVVEQSTGNIYAAKVMDTNSMSAKDRGFVMNEAKCLASCDSANVVRHYKSFEKDGMLLIVMEFADGGDMYRQIKGRQRQQFYLKEHEVVFVFLQLCLALDHIHSNKIMHRDLKTANVLLTTTGLVKLGDFGFSRQYEDSLSKSVGSTFCGTPYYLSPELWRRAPYSKKSEMWALGVVLYEVMALKRPFNGSNMEELVGNIVHGRRDPLPSCYSKELRDVCDQLLSLDPAARPSVRQLFGQPYIRTSLETLRHSVIHHSGIPEDARQEIVVNISTVLSEDFEDNESLHIEPRTGIVKRHSVERGWQDCELYVSSRGIQMRDFEDSDKIDFVALRDISTICQVDSAIAGEEFVFAMKSQAGKAFWFRAFNSAAYYSWLTVLSDLIA